MYADIVVSKGNEVEFIKRAELLDYDALFLLGVKSVEELQKKTSIKLFCSTDLNIKKSDESIRNVIEKGVVDVVYSFEEDIGQDAIHQRSR